MTLTVEVPALKVWFVEAAGIKAVILIHVTVDEPRLIAFVLLFDPKPKLEHVRAKFAVSKVPSLTVMDFAAL